MEVEATVVDVQLELLAAREAAQEAGVGLAGLVDDFEHLAGVLDVDERALVAVFFRDGPGDVGPAHVLPGTGLLLPVHEHARRPTLEGQRRETLELADHHAARRRHVAGVAPAHLEHSAAGDVLAVEERQVEVVELDGDLVRFAFGVLEGERDDAVA